MIYIGDTEITAMHLGASEVLSVALGDQVVYEKSSEPVLLDYITFDPSNGLPYFDTGIYQSDDLVVEVALQAESFNATNPLFGGGCLDTAMDQEQYQGTRVFGVWNRMYVDGRGRYTSRLGDPMFNAGFNVLSVNYGGASGQKVVLFNGNQLYSGTPSGNLDTTYKVCINAWLARPGETSPDVNQAGVWRMAYFKMWQGGQLVRDFRPCGPTNDTHLWDEVTHTEYAPEQGSCTGGNLWTPDAYLYKTSDTGVNFPLFTFEGNSGYPEFRAELCGTANGNCFIGFQDDDNADYRIFDTGGVWYMDAGSNRANGAGPNIQNNWALVSAWNCGWQVSTESQTGYKNGTPTTDTLSGVVQLGGASTTSRFAIGRLSVIQGGNLTHEYIPISDDVYGPGLSDAVGHTKHFPEDSTGAWHYEES